MIFHPFILLHSSSPLHLQQQQRQEHQFILHASKNEGLESGFEVDRLGKAVHGFPSGRYFKKVDQCLLALFFPDVAGVSSKNIQQAGPSRERRNEKAYTLSHLFHEAVGKFRNNRETFHQGQRSPRGSLMRRYIREISDELPLVDSEDHRTTASHIWSRFAF